MSDTSEYLTDASIAQQREALHARRRQLKTWSRRVTSAGWAAACASFALLLLAWHLHENLWLLWVIVGPANLIGIIATFAISEKEWALRCELDQLRLENRSDRIEIIEEFCQMSQEAGKIREAILAAGRQIYTFDFDAMLEAAADVLADASPAARAVRDKGLGRGWGMCVLLFSRMQEAQREEMAA